MKSIITTYIQATNTKPARIKAKAEGVPAIVMSWGEAEHKAVSHDGHTGQDDIFKAVALAMCAKYNWPVDLVGGGLPDSTGYAWCFVPARHNMPAAGLEEEGRNGPCGLLPV